MLLDEPNGPSKTGACSGEAGKQPSVGMAEKLTPGYKPNLTSRTNSIPRPSFISIFSYLDGVPNITGIDESVLNEHLLEVEDFLLNQTNFTDRKAYRQCSASSRVDVHGMLEKRGFDLGQSSKSSTKDQLSYESDVEIFNFADAIFRFFFPPHVQVATVAKFWGAVKWLVDVSVMPACSNLHLGVPGG